MEKQEGQCELDSEFELMNVAFVLFREAQSDFSVAYPLPGVTVRDSDAIADLITEDGWKRPLRAAFLVDGLYGTYRVTVEGNADHGR